MIGKYMFFKKQVSALVLLTIVVFLFSHVGSAYAGRHKKTDHCAAGKAKEKKILRPMNSFMVFAKMHRKEVALANPAVLNAAISKILGTIWKSMSKEEQRPYIDKAGKLAKQHRIDNPGWTYKPQRKIKGKKPQKALEPVADPVDEKSACLDEEPAGAASSDGMNALNEGPLNDEDISSDNFLSTIASMTEKEFEEFLSLDT